MKNKKKTYGKTDKAAWLFLLPAGIIYISVIVAPIFYSLFISFYKWNGIGDKVFIGLQNYKNLFSGDKTFHTAIVNNLIWIILTIFITMTVSLAFAVILNKKFAGRTFFRGFFYFPCVIAPIAVAIIWRWIYNPAMGFINEFFDLIGLNYTQSWISDPNASLYAVFMAALWQAIGQPMILFLAGLQAISSDVLEAATIDGANGVKKFFMVTIPLLKDTFVIVIATLIVAAMKVFDVVQGLTGGGPGDSTQMISTYMYSQVFQYNNVGYGTAIACVMVVMMMVVIIPYVLFTAKEN
ncbi:MAG TPA: sugar ABC transporter permease [Candidatus Pelethocola excrementipullorum]|nr:sugar ABC transporter permease [Candidatus Pelethocola excrementipullorum]